MIRIGIVGTGGMAHAHARAFQQIRGCKLAAACDVVEGKAEQFAREFDIPAAFTDFDAMLAGTELDAISNVTPDAFHGPLSLKAISAGLHVLCEKPLAVSYPEARRMAQAARRKGVINMVNFTYRNAAALHKARDLVQDGQIGRVLHVQAHYLQSWLVSKAWGDWRTGPAWLWRLSTKHGSKGVLGDIGVHVIDFATYAAGRIRQVNCRLKTFPKAKANRIGEYKLDANDSALIMFELADGGVGTITTSRWATGHVNSLRLAVHGDQGALVIDLDDGYDQLKICRGKDIDRAKWKTLRCRKTPSVYRRFVNSIRKGVNDQPDFARGAAVQKVLDACFESDRMGRAVDV